MTQTLTWFYLLNENDLSVSFLNLWGVRSQCCDHFGSSVQQCHRWSKLGHPAQNCTFFLTRKAFIKTRNRCVFFASTCNETFQTRTAASPQRQARVKWASAEQWDAVRLYVSKTIFPVLSAVTVLTTHALYASSWINAQETAYESVVSLVMKLPKMAIKAANCACMNALHFRTSLKCILKYRLSCDSNCIQLCFRH